MAHNKWNLSSGRRRQSSLFSCAGKGQRRRKASKTMHVVVVFRAHFGSFSSQRSRQAIGGAEVEFAP